MWYECPYCGKLFPTQATLEAHIVLDHPEVPPPVYTCPYCGAEFDSAAGLSGHIALVHPTPPPVYWFVADPDGMIVDEYEDWEWGTTGPDDDHHFIGGRFNLDREKYTMWVELLMNPDNPEVVDRYIGDLCTVSAPEYKGTISKKELEYDGTRNTIPVY